MIPGLHSFPLFVKTFSFDHQSGAGVFSNTILFQIRKWAEDLLALKRN